MATHTRRLGESSVATAGAGATTTIFTCPANRTAIIKDVRVWMAAGAINLICTLSVAMASTASRSVAQFTNLAVGPSAMTVLPNTQEAARPPWIVLQEGDALKIAQPAGCTVQTYVSGTLLTGDPV